MNSGDDHGWTPAHIAPIVGEWKTKHGRYTIKFEDGLMKFQEGSLYGALKLQGEWFETPVKDAKKNDALIGYLRLKAEGACIRSNFKENINNDWDNPGTVA